MEKLPLVIKNDEHIVKVTLEYEYSETKNTTVVDFHLFLL